MKQSNVYRASQYNGTSISIKACQQQFVVGAPTTERRHRLAGRNISSSQTSFLNKILDFKLGGAEVGGGGAPMRQQRGSQVLEAAQQEAGQ